MKPATEMTAARLRELLHYDPETGLFTWRVRKSTRVHIGQVAGSEHGNGYIRLPLDGGRYFAHRLAWLYMTGGWPKGEVDHIDGARWNNRWENLRDVTRGENNQNHKAARSDSASGLIGVLRYRDRWIARITVGGKQKHLGIHDTAQQAFAAYVEAKRQLHPANTL